MSAAAWLSAGLVGAAVVLALVPRGWVAETTRTPRSRPVPDGSNRVGRGPAAARPDPVGPPSSRRTAVIAAAALVAGVSVGGLTAGVAIGAVLVVGRAVLVRQARRHRALAVATALPELIDLFVIAASAGHPVRTCFELVAGRAPAPVRPALEAARARVGRGEPLASALAGLGEPLGPAGAPLVDALVAGLLTGAPLGPALARAAEAARDARRRRAEASARRLPVTLLFPLVCCVLPAFGLLAVVPLLAASLASLRS